MNNKLSLHLGLIALSLLALTIPYLIVSTPAQAKPRRGLEMIQSQGGFTGFPRQTFGNSIPRETINRPAPSFSSPAPFKVQTPPGRGFGPIQRPIQRENRLELLQSRPGLNVLPGQTAKPPFKHKDFIHQSPVFSKPELQRPHPVTINPIPTSLKPIYIPLKPKPPHIPHKPKPPHIPQKPKPPHHHHHHYHYSYWNSFWIYPNWYAWQPGGFWYPLRSQIQEARCPNPDDPLEDLEIGTILSNLPANAEGITVKETRYYRVCGSYLLPSGSGYRVVAPPIGAIVSDLPEESVVIYDSSNTPYFYHNGTFFSHSNEGYTIVLPPSGIEVPYLPEGYTSVTIHGNLYYLYGEVTYQMASRNGKSVYVVSN